jgi:hypothetical protein
MNPRLMKDEKTDDGRGYAIGGCRCALALTIPVTGVTAADDRGRL